MMLKLTGCAALLGAATLMFAFSDDTFQGNVVKRPFDAAIHGQSPTKTSSTQILYHGGPVMNLSNSVYVIYYGNFPSTTEPIINTFMAGLSGNGPYTVNHTYSDATSPSPATIPTTYFFQTPVGSGPATVRDGSVIGDNYSQGTSLSSGDIQKIVTHAIGAGLPADQKAVYLVLTAPDVKVSGFCTSFCAYHNTSKTIISGTQIRYALIPYPTQKCTGCNGNIAVYGDTVTPNGDMGADTMTDDIMHELSETVTDPDISAWYTQNGAENGDLCNYVYETALSPIKTTTVGTTTTHYNVTLGGKNFLVQLIWKNSSPGFCAVN
jgi:hypothetical protein